jgi:hypothetical protein
MANRLLFPAITLFWISMNVLLWRSEFSGGVDLGSAVPVESVWQRILTAPDDSSLEISRNGEKIGYCRWRPNVGEELRAGKVGDEDFDLQGRVQALSGYRIDLEGSVSNEDPNERFRFNLHAAFDTNHQWTEIAGRFPNRSGAWEVRALAAEQTLTVHSGSSDAPWEKQLRLSDLRNPASILTELGLPMAQMALVPLGLKNTPSEMSLGLQWQAHNDWFTIGHSRIRVYRLRAKLVDRFEVVVIVSRIGEILRVELPNQIVLSNDAFNRF